MPKFFALVAALCTLAVSGGTAATAGPPVFGVTEDATKYAADGGDALVNVIYRELGMTENRVTIDFDPNQPTTIQEKAFLDRSIPRIGIDVVFAVYPRNPRAFETDVDARVAAYANYVKLLAQTYPKVKKYVLLNESNEAFFQVPQKDAAGNIVSAETAFKAVAAGYDALKSVDPNITVIGFGLSPEANDRTSISPVRWIKALGDAYRKSGRNRQFMDELALHLYPRDASRHDESTHYQWPNSGAADLDRVKQAVWDAFNGTAQPVFQETAQAVGPVLKFKLDEVGWQVGVLPQLAHLYHNAENTPVTDEARQARIYRALVLKLACDVTVAEILFFHLLDDPDLRRFQSALMRADGTRREAFSAVAAAIVEARAQGCSTPHVWRHTEKPVAGKATFDTKPKPGAQSIFGLSVTAEEEALALGGLFRLNGPKDRLTRTRVDLEFDSLQAGAKRAEKKVNAYHVPRLEFRGRVDPGHYAHAVRLTPTMNPRRSETFLSAPFTIGTPPVETPIETEVSILMPDYPKLRSTRRQVEEDLTERKKLNVEWRYVPTPLSQVPEKLADDIEAFEVYRTDPEAGAKLKSTFRKPQKVTLFYWDPFADPKRDDEKCAAAYGNVFMLAALSELPLVKTPGYDHTAIEVLQELKCKWDVRTTRRGPCTMPFPKFENVEVVKVAPKRWAYRMDIVTPKCPDFWATFEAWYTNDTLGIDTQRRLTANVGAGDQQVLTLTVQERATGRYVKNAKVELRDPDGKPFRNAQGSLVSTSTDGDGKASIGGLRFLKPGMYSVVVTAKTMEGFFPIEFVERNRQPFTTIDGRRFEWSGGGWFAVGLSKTGAGLGLLAPLGAEADPVATIASLIGQLVNAVFGAPARLVEGVKAIFKESSVSASGRLSKVRNNSKFRPALMASGDGTTGGTLGLANLTTPKDGTVGLVGQDGSTLVGQDGSTLVGQDGSTLIGKVKLVGQDGSTLVLKGTGLVGQDGSTLTVLRDGHLISDKGAGLVGDASATAISENGAGLVDAARGQVVELKGTSFISEQGGALKPGTVVSFAPGDVMPVLAPPR